MLVTGHTGFKGGWLSLWLNMLGARVYGYALQPPTEPSLWCVCRLGEGGVVDRRGDVADGTGFCDVIRRVRPEVVLHLAAQPLVRESYATPVTTFMTNTMGTAHVLEGCREGDALRAVVVITTDKVYQNREWEYPYRENDRLAGHDPYSASKAAAELVVESYRKSFFSGEGAPRIATARAGNVIGGGDWANDRLVPDCLRAFAREETVILRNPEAVRPWQHVLEPLRGYLLLAQKLFASRDDACARGFNFGPDMEGHVPVESVARELARLWGTEARVACRHRQDEPHEAGLLKLDTGLARALLDWRPRWSVADALFRTVQWHKAWLAGDNMREFSLRQIEAYASGDDVAPESRGIG